MKEYFVKVYIGGSDHPTFEVANDLEQKQNMVILTTGINCAFLSVRS